MRTFKFNFRSGIAALILLFSCNLIGASITSMEIVPVKNEKVFLLTVKSSGNGMIIMRVKNSKGKTIFFEEHQSLASFVKKINLSNFENGDYTFELEDEILLNISPIKLDNSGVIFGEGNSTKLFKPYIRWDSKNRNLDIDWRLNEVSNVKVVITDEEFNVLHQNKFKNLRVVQKRFQLMNVKEGRYSITIENKDRTYSLTFDVI